MGSVISIANAVRIKLGRFSKFFFVQVRNSTKNVEFKFRNFHELIQKKNEFALQKSNLEVLKLTNRVEFGQPEPKKIQNG